MIVTRRVAQLEAQDTRHQIRRYVGQAFKVISKGMLVGLLLYILLSPISLAALDIASPIPLVVLAAAAATGLWLPLWA